MRRIFAAGLLTLSACGAATSSGSTGSVPAGGGDQTAQVVSTGDGFHVSTTGQSRTLKHDVSAPMERVWQALPEVYREIGLQGTADGASLTVTSPTLRFTRRMFGEPATRFFDCGRGQFGSQIAATHTIHLTVRTTVQPGGTPGTSRLETTAQAYARNNDGANALMAQCHSREQLENLIALRVLEKLAG